MQLSTIYQQKEEVNSENRDKVTAAEPEKLQGC
jgi:hypothetical protein